MTTKQRVILDQSTGKFLVENVATVKEGNIEDLLQQLASTGEYSTPALPRGTIWYRKTAAGSLYTVYRPAEIITTGWRGQVHTNEGTREVDFGRVKLLSPPRIFVIPIVGNVPLLNAVVETFCTARRQEDVTTATECFIPWYPNTYSSPYAAICFGTGQTSLAKDTNKQPAETQVNAIISYLDKPVFNNHVLYFGDWIDTLKLREYVSKLDMEPEPDPLWLACNNAHKYTEAHMQLAYNLKRITGYLLHMHPNVEEAGNALCELLNQVYVGRRHAVTNIQQVAFDKLRGA